MIAEDLKKTARKGGHGLGGLQRKLFGKDNEKRKKELKALTRGSFCVPIRRWRRRFLSSGEKIKRFVPEAEGRDFILKECSTVSILILIADWRSSDVVCAIALLIDVAR
ncbi:hypothetical protein LINGRAPRIM_LOCUS2974, partial [Linum grandiflorum]